MLYHAVTRGALRGVTLTDQSRQGNILQGKGSLTTATWPHAYITTPIPPTHVAYHTYQLHNTKFHKSS